MPRRLLAVNVVLAGVSLLCVSLIVKQLIGSRPAAPSRSRPPAAALAAPPSAAGSPRLPAQAYSVIATRNLFSPTRSETPGAGMAGGPAINIVKPSLHGVVLRDGPPILPPGQPIPPPVQQPAPGLQTPVPFGRPSPSLGRRFPPVPIDPAVPQQSTPQN